MNSPDNQDQRQDALDRLRSIRAQIPEANWNQEGTLISKVLKILVDQFLEMQIECKGLDDPLLIELVSIQNILTSEPDRDNLKDEIRIWVKQSQ
jgi:hypothetical protein